MSAYPFIEPPQERPEELAALLAVALTELDRHELRIALSLGELGDIQLPEGPGMAVQAQALEPVPTFYLAYQLDAAGLLRCAERVAALAMGGGVTAPLGTAAPLIRAFWQARHERFNERERGELFQSLFQQPGFHLLLANLVRDILRHADNRGQGDWQEAVSLELSGRQLVDYLGVRIGGMTAFAARDITNAINAGLTFLRDPALHRAFGVPGLWALVAATSTGPTAQANLRRHLEMGESGRVLLTWLVEASRNGNLRLAPRAAATMQLIMAAEGWRLAFGTSVAPIPG